MEVAGLGGQPKYVSRSVLCQTEVDGNKHQQTIPALDVYIGGTLFSRFHSLNTFMYSFGNSGDSSHDHIRKLNPDGSTWFLKAGSELQDQLFEIASYINSPVLDSLTIKWYKRVGEVANLSVIETLDEPDPEVKIEIDGQLQAAVGLGFVHLIDKAQLSDSKRHHPSNKAKPERHLQLVHSTGEVESFVGSMAVASLRVAD